MDKPKTILSEVGKELKANPPSILKNTQEKFGVTRAAKQKKAILLSKARKGGANIPLKGGY